MRKMLFLSLVAMLVLVVFAAGPARASPVVGPSEEVFLASTTANLEILDNKAGTVVLSPGFGLGRAIYANLYDRVAHANGPSKEWVRVLSTGVRISKWPGTLVAPAPNFNPLAAAA